MSTLEEAKQLCSTIDELFSKYDLEYNVQDEVLFYKKDNDTGNVSILRCDTKSKMPISYQEVKPKPKGNFREDVLLACYIYPDTPNKYSSRRSSRLYDCLNNYPKTISDYKPLVERTINYM